MPQTSRSNERSDEQLEDAINRFRALIAQDNDNSSDGLVKIDIQPKVFESEKVLARDPIHDMIRRRLRKQREQRKRDTFDGRSIADLGFVYNICPSMSRGAIHRWMRFSPFTDRVRELCNDGVKVSESDIVSIMRDLTVSYDKKYGKKSRLNEHDYQRAIRSYDYHQSIRNSSEFKQIGVITPKGLEGTGIKVPVAASSTKVLKSDAKRVGVKEIP